LAAFPFSSLLTMTGTSFKNHWSWRLISPSLTLHSPSVNSPSNQLPTSSTYFVIGFLLFCTPVFLLAHPYLHIYHSSVNC
jgi:hypothetical protein